MPTKLSAREVLAILGLPGCGRKIAHSLIRGLTVSPLTLLEWADVLAEVGKSVSRFRPPSVEAVSVAFNDADEVLQLAQASGIDVHSIGSQSYPARLQRMPDPPLVLFTKGNWSSLAAVKSLALIGTRKPSPRGGYSARRIGRSLAEKGCVVVSGLAMGCDAEGHRGCLEGGGTGVAVLAHGLHMVSPASSRQLAEELLAHGGCLVSEYPPGVPARSRHFVERDRIQSGLSDAVIVVEASLASGSMKTVGFAKAQRRRIACVPPTENTAQYRTGNQALLGDESTLAIRCPSDIDALLVDLYPSLPTVSREEDVVEQDRTAPQGTTLGEEDAGDGSRDESSYAQKDLPF